MFVEFLVEDCPCDSCEESRVEDEEYRREGKRGKSIEELETEYMYTGEIFYLDEDETVYSHARRQEEEIRHEWMLRRHTWIDIRKRLDSNFEVDYEDPIVECDVKRRGW